MTALEIGDIVESGNPDDAVKHFNSYVASNYGGYFPDQRGTAELAADFIKGASTSILQHLKDGQAISFIAEDTAAQDVDDLRSGLKIDSFRTPLLTIANYLVNNWLVFAFGDEDDELTSLFRAYASDVFAPAPRDEKEAWMNAATYMPEGDELAALYNSIAETQVEHLSGKHMQDGAFLVYDGTKYDAATKDPNMVLFE